MTRRLVRLLGTWLFADTLAAWAAWTQDRIDEGVDEWARDR